MDEGSSEFSPVPFVLRGQGDAALHSVTAHIEIPAVNTEDVETPAVGGGRGEVPTLWTVILLCMGLSVVMTFAELVVGVLGAAFEQDLGVATAQLGMLMVVFFIANGLVVVPAGFFADRVDSRHTILFQIFLGVAILAAFAWAQGPMHLFILCALSGAALGLNGPIVNRIIVDFVVVEKRSIAIAWKSFGFQVAGVLTGLIFGATASFMDWRATILWCAAVMVPFGIWGHMKFRHARHAAGVLPITVSIPIQKATLSTETIERKTKTARKRRAAPVVWWLIPYSLFTTGAFTCVAAYMVFFGATEVGISAGEAGVASGVAASVSLGARFLWVKWLTPRNEVLMLGLAAVTSAIAVLALAISPYTGRMGFWAAAILLGLTMWATGPIQQVALLRNTHPRYIGRISSVVMLANSISLAGMPLVMALFIEGMGLSTTWYLIVAMTMLGGVVMGIFVVVRHFTGGREASELKLS